jgi:GT2 family glycosyltransferase/glycosyltransferase involved in cell wall biosynthesis
MTETGATGISDAGRAVRRALIVLGMHRSGTSALTRVLGLLGARLPSEMLAANPDNPRGFWESRAIVHRHEALLREQASFWHDILPVPDDWYASPEARRFEDLLVEDLRGDFGDAPLVVIKDPRMCRLMPLWRRVLDRAGLEPTVIITLRDAIESAASLQRRNGFPMEKGLLLWLAHMQAAEFGSRGMNRVFVSYDDLLRDWRDAVSRISARAGVEFDVLTRAAEIEGFLSADLRHAPPSGFELDHFGEVGSWVRTLTDEFRRASSGGDAEIDAAVLDRAYRGFAALVNIIRPVESFNRRALAELAPRVSELSNQVKALNEQVAAYQKETARLQGMELRVAAMEATMSWRITAPLRALKLRLWLARKSARRGLRLLAFSLLRGLRACYRRLPLPVAWKESARAALSARIPRLFSLLQHGWLAWDGETYPALESAFRLELPGDAAVEAGSIALPPCREPEISIVIPVFNNLDFTLACLQSVAKQSAPAGFEVIVIDDYSSDRTADVLRPIAGLRYFRNDRNVGFIGSCNRGAAEARGRFLVILNNDTYVQPGWLAELYQTMMTEERAGLIGSQLLYPDGTLQEAGGLVWSDGNAWNYGRGQDRRRPEFNYLRDVDYCSGASLFIATSLFRELGGFDEAYEPAYYEDTDLAFKIRRRGLRVLYQPLSRVVHYEGVSSGTDINSGVKRHQSLNQSTFFNRWRTELTAQSAGPAAAAELQQPAVPRVLIVDSYTPTPDRDSGSVDAFQLMRILRDIGCAVTFIGDDELQLQERYTADLQRLGVQCLYQPFLESTEQFLEESAGHFEVVFLTRFSIAERLLAVVRRSQPRARIIFIAVDLHHVRLMREAKLRDSEKLEREAQSAQIRELAVIGAADLAVVKSNTEIVLLRSELPQAGTFMLPLIIETPGALRTGFHDRANFLFVGGFRHPPNVDAVLHFVRKEWPLVRARLPEARLLIVGSEAPREITELNIEGVDVIGYVRDLARYLSSCRVMVAPLRFGAGVKGKIGHAIGYGLPCVATPLAVEGMGLREGSEVVVAELGQPYADACADFYQDERRWGKISAAGQAFFEENYSLRVGRNAVHRMLQAVGAVGKLTAP